MTEPQKCARCPRLELIPTHCHIRWDGEDLYFCERCWEELCSWRHGWPRYAVGEFHAGR